jgi:RecA-family ATPase
VSGPHYDRERVVQALQNVSDWLVDQGAAGHSPSEEERVAYLNSLLGKGRPAPEGVTDYGKLLVTATEEWYTTPLPERRWLLRDTRHPKKPGVFPLGKVGQLISEGGIGKTRELISLAVATTTGGLWLGTFEVSEPGRVLLVLGEEDAEEARRRLFTAARVGRVTPRSGDIDILPLAGLPVAMLERDDHGNIVDAAFLEWLRKGANIDSYRLVVVDPLARFAGFDAEKDNAAGTRFIQALETLVSPERGVLNAHHTNKISRGKNGRLEASAGRGVTAFVDGARWQAGMAVDRYQFDSPEQRDRLGRVVIFGVTKSNYSKIPEDVLLRYDDDNDGALVPLDEDDLATIEAVRAAKKRSGGDEAAEDEAVLAAAAKQPGMSFRKLRAAVQKATGCSEKRAEKAIDRMRSKFDVRPGKRNADCYFLKDEPRP